MNHGSAQRGVHRRLGFHQLKVRDATPACRRPASMLMGKWRYSSSLPADPPRALRVRVRKVRQTEGVALSASVCAGGAARAHHRPHGARFVRQRIDTALKTARAIIVLVDELGTTRLVRAL